MPRIHRPMTFNAATKHLFRHLNDPRQLRLNPIAGHFFQKHTPDGPHDTQSDLAELQGLIIRTARRCRDEIIAIGKVDKAIRQLAIITLQYSDGLSISQAAKQLGVSVKHCYRERSEICQRIARCLYRRNQAAEVVAHDNESFYFLLEHAWESSVCAPQSALRACHYLEHVAESHQQKIDAVQVAITISVYFGDTVLAEAAVSRLLRLYDEHFLGAPHLELQTAAQASVNVALSRLASHHGDTDQALAKAQSAVQQLEHFPISQTNYAKAFWIESRFNLALRLWHCGRLAAAYDSLDAAASKVQHLPLSSPLRLRTLASLWKLRNYLLPTSESSYSSEVRLTQLRAAFAHAHKMGWLLDAVDILISIIDCHVFAKRDEQALRSARRALALLSKANNPIKQLETSIDIGLRLLDTKYWRQAMKLCPPRDRITDVDAYHRKALQYSLASLALRLGDYQSAWHYSSRSNHIDVLKNVAWTTNALRCQLVAAGSAYRLGLKRAARESAEHAVYNAECLGAAPLLAEAYQVAAVIRGDGRLGRRAREISRILAI